MLRTKSGKTVYFLDEITIKIQSGNGGRGCMSFLRRQDRKRTADGGDGGDGGNIILQADSQTGSLVSLRSKAIFEAERGEGGTSSKSCGRSGRDLIVKVPCGTTVYNKTDQLLMRDLVNHGDEFIAAKGGKGGFGNHSERPEPIGGAGIALELFLSFKIIADVFLIGLPNSGKTLLLRELTGAGVTESEHPFSTKAPHLGTYQSYSEDVRMCELPSLYQASEDGHGLGTSFLKHLERAKLIFVVLDPTSEFGADVSKASKMLCGIIERFDPEFSKIQRILVVNKIDLISPAQRKKIKAPKDEKMFFISAKKKIGFSQLMEQAVKTLKHCS